VKKHVPMRALTAAARAGAMSRRSANTPSTGSVEEEKKGEDAATVPSTAMPLTTMATMPTMATSPTAAGAGAKAAAAPSPASVVSPTSRVKGNKENDGRRLSLRSGLRPFLDSRKPTAAAESTTMTTTTSMTTSMDAASLAVAATPTPAVSVTADAANVDADVPVAMVASGSSVQGVEGGAVDAVVVGSSESDADAEVEAEAEAEGEAEGEAEHISEEADTESSSDSDGEAARSLGSVDAARGSVADTEGLEDTSSIAASATTSAPSTPSRGATVVAGAAVQSSSCPSTPLAIAASATSPNRSAAKEAAPLPTSATRSALKRRADAVSPVPSTRRVSFSVQPPMLAASAPAPVMMVPPPPPTRAPTTTTTTAPSHGWLSSVVRLSQPLKTAITSVFASFPEPPAHFGDDDATAPAPALSAVAASGSGSGSGVGVSVVPNLVDACPFSPTRAEVLRRSGAHGGDVQLPELHFPSVSVPAPPSLDSLFPDTDDVSADVDGDGPRGMRRARTLSASALVSDLTRALQGLDCFPEERPALIPDGMLRSWDRLVCPVSMSMSMSMTAPILTRTRERVASGLHAVTSDIGAALKERKQAVLQRVHQGVEAFNAAFDSTAFLASEAGDSDSDNDDGDVNVDRDSSTVDAASTDAVPHGAGEGESGASSQPRDMDEVSKDDCDDAPAVDVATTSTTSHAPTSQPPTPSARAAVALALAEHSATATTALAPLRVHALDAVSRLNVMVSSTATALNARLTSLRSEWSATRAAEIALSCLPNLDRLQHTGGGGGGGAGSGVQTTVTASHVTPILAVLTSDVSGGEGDEPVAATAMPSCTSYTMPGEMTATTTAAHHDDNDDDDDASDATAMVAVVPVTEAFSEADAAADTPVDAST
jgi:hypothetical protein